jgi:hypothetical protein
MAEIVTPLEFDEERGRPCGGDSNEVSSQR